MADKINKEESIARVYQFLNNYNGNWKEDADRNSDGVIIKSEFSTFIHISGFQWDGETTARQQEDLITAFWRSIDTGTTGKINGKNVSDKGALNRDELLSVGNNIIATDIINKYMQRASVPTGIKNSGYESKWIQSVKAGMINRAIEFLKGTKEDLKKLADNEKDLKEKIEELLNEEKLQEFFKLSSVKATADYKALEMFDKLTNDLQEKYGEEYGGLEDYAVADDQTLKRIINSYIKQLNGDEDADTICKEIEDIVQAYMNTATGEGSTEALSPYYSPYEFNPLQKAVLTAQMQKDILDRVKNEKPDIYNNCLAVLEPSVKAYVKNIISTVNNFQKIKNNMNDIIDGYIKSEALTNLQAEYNQLLTDREALISSVETEWNNSDHSSERQEAIKKIFGADDLDSIKSNINGYDRTTLDSKKAEFEAKIKNINGLVDGLLDSIPENITVLVNDPKTFTLPNSSGQYKTGQLSYSIEDSCGGVVSLNGYELKITGNLPGASYETKIVVRDAENNIIATKTINISVRGANNSEMTYNGITFDELINSPTGYETIYNAHQSWDDFDAQSAISYVSNMIDNIATTLINSGGYNSSKVNTAAKAMKEIYTKIINNLNFGTTQSNPGVHKETEISYNVDGTIYTESFSYYSCQSTYTDDLNDNIVALYNNKHGVWSNPDEYKHTETNNSGIITASTNAHNHILIRIAPGPIISKFLSILSML